MGECESNIVHLQRGGADRGVSAAHLERLFKEHESGLTYFLEKRLGSLADAQDARQIVFMRLLERRESLRDEQLVSLIFLSARNLATDMLRERKRKQSEPLLTVDAHEWLGDCSPSAERALSAKQDIALIARILDELPTKCRQAFISYRFSMLGYEEIALQMGVGESMVRKYVRRALTHCVSRYNELGGWE